MGSKDVKICGKRGGNSFEDVNRPNLGGSCPEGMSPCIADGDPENMVCYHEDDHQTACPITDVVFVATSDPSLSKYADYSSTEFDTEYTILWSKKVDSLPIT